jgi:uncharacterized membrane protein
MRDRGNQFVLGIFTATFIYCLLILRVIRGVGSSIFVPHISVLLGLGLSIASLAVLIYFIHHVSQSIQAPNIISRITDDLMDTINDVFPAKLGKALPETDDDYDALLQQIDREGHDIEMDRSGYLQMVDDSALLKTARQHDLLIRLDVMPGQFLFRGQTVARVLPPDHASDDIDRDIRGALIIGSQRTRTQDVLFIIIQLAALAVRSLSPGINDPYSAIMVIDHLGEALCALLRRQPPSKYRYDDDDHLRVIAQSVTFETAFHTAFDQIIHYGYGDLKVTVRLLEVFNALWQCAEQPEQRTYLRLIAEHLYEESYKRLSPSENERLHSAYRDIFRDPLPEPGRTTT